MKDTNRLRSDGGTCAFTSVVPRGFARFATCCDIVGGFAPSLWRLERGFKRLHGGEALGHRLLGPHVHGF